MRRPLAGRAAVVLAMVAVVGAVSVGGPSVAAAGPVPTPHVERACSQPMDPGVMACLALIRTDIAQGMHLSLADPPDGYDPADLQSAYGLPATFGAGRTVAIVAAYDDPRAESDLATYRDRYGLPPCTTTNGCFTKVNQDGAASPLPVANTGWAAEISLDLDMVSAVCPLCHILLVEADNDGDNGNIFAAEDYATAHASYVSNSFGRAERSTDLADNAHFDRPGVVITVASGDQGFDGGSYPATSPYVIAVGGTSLVRDGSSRGWSETAWNGAGSGCSKYEPRPSWQGSYTGCARRAEADVSAVADLDTGVSFYDSYFPPNVPPGWLVGGGTSAAAPIIAAAYALAEVPGATDYPVQYPYANTGLENDVTAGSNGSCGTPICIAGRGWDGPTGIGTPHGLGLLSNLAVHGPINAVGRLGAPLTVQLSVSGGTTPYTWTVTNIPAGLTFDPATVQISGTPTELGTSEVVFTAFDAVGAVSFSAVFVDVRLPQVQVPNVRGLEPADAEAAMLAAGVVVTQEVDQVDSRCRFLGLVIDQAPSPGIWVERNSNATLYIGIPPPPRPGCRR